MKHLFLALFILFCFVAFADLSFNVTYTGFDALQMAAFEHALGYWEPVLDSDVPIKINARFQQIPGFVMVFVPNMIRNFNGAPQTNIWYCTALANMISGTELNTGEADMDMFIIGNADHPWYYGLDDNCPAGSYDFVSEVFKAVAYGLGYMPSFYVQQGYGSYGMLDPSVLGLTTSFPWEPMQNQPALYDTHVVNTQGQHLTDTAIFSNPSPGLNAQLTGGNLRYQGQWGEAFGGGTQPVLYAGVFNLARTARLAGTTYNGTENEPGVPTGILGGGVRFPSPIVLGILKDLGWTVNTDSLCDPPQGLEGTSYMGNVHLGWELPLGPYVMHSVTIYRDGEQIAVQTDNLLEYNDMDVPPGSYQYSVSVQYSMGSSQAVSTMVTVDPVDVDDPLLAGPELTHFKISPNPFNGAARISFELARATEIRIDVYNLRGQKIHSLPSALMEAGEHSISLNGFDLDSGLYLIRLQTHDQVFTHKALLIR